MSTPTNWQVRRATPDDVYGIARLRRDMWNEMQPDRPADNAYRDALYTYWYETLESGAGVGWVGENRSELCGMAMLLRQTHPPRPFGPIVRGYITSVYVVPAQRRTGLGRALMNQVIAYGRAEGMQRLELRSSDAGRYLYHEIGFEPVELLIYNL